MKIRLDPEDEYLHPLEDATNFNESMYFNVYDPAEKIGGFLRLGNRANEGYAEMTTCIYLPDGRVGQLYCPCIHTFLTALLNSKIKILLLITATIYSYIRYKVHQVII